MYIARQLSFHGVTFLVREVPLSEDFIDMYDAAVELVGGGHAACTHTHTRARSHPHMHYQMHVHAESLVWQ